LARALARAGLAVLLFDYRGYGGNPGRPSEQGLACDVRAARRFLVEEAEVAPARLLYYGESLGAAVVTERATEHPPAGLVLRSPFVRPARRAAADPSGRRARGAGLRSAPNQGLRHTSASPPPG
jgi:alpha-beta hydrolase superfamily lysophospholipase